MYKIISNIRLNAHKVVYCGHTFLETTLEGSRILFLSRTQIKCRFIIFFFLIICRHLVNAIGLLLLAKDGSLPIFFLCMGMIVLSFQERGWNIISHPHGIEKINRVFTVSGCMYNNFVCDTVATQYRVVETV